MTSVLICSKLYSHGDVRYGILVDGEHYTVNKHILAALQSGDTVEDLALEPDEGDDADDEPELSPGHRQRSNARSGMFG